MVICLEQGANDLHIVQLMPLPPHHLLLQQNPEWFILLVPATHIVLEKRSLNAVCVCVQSIHTDDGDDAMVLSSTVLIGQYKALVRALVGDLDGANAEPPRVSGRPLDTVVDVILECHVLRQRQNARRPIPHHVRSLPANLVDTHTTCIQIQWPK